MSAKLATWLRVTPSPTTLAESSAIYQALSKQGRVSVFARCKDSGHEQVNTSHGSSSTFYAVFPHEPPTLRTTFEVPVYHGLPSARDEDPFNIRGLQNRKPMPAPKTFSCVIEKTYRNEIRSTERTIIKGNPYYGHFAVEEKGWLEGALTEMNAPPGLARGCGIRTQDKRGTVSSSPNSDGQDEPAQRSKVRKINMGSLMDMWHEATNSREQNVLRKEDVEEPGASERRAVNRIMLNADRPLGKS